MKFDTTTLLSGLHFLESPRWHNGRVWMSDIYAHRVYSAAEDGQDLRVEAEFDGLPSGLGWLPDDTLLTSMTGRDYRLLRRSPTGELTVHADLGDAHGPLSDMITDQDGTAYVGAFGFDAAAGAPIAEGAIYRVTPQGKIEMAADGLLIPNGMAITDDRRLVVNESFGNRITTFTIAADGSLHDRAELARFGPPPTSRSIAEVIPALAVTPDGCALDAEGGLWVADPERNRAIRLRADGTHTDTIEAEDEIFACALGGQDGRTLFLCAAPDSNPARRTEQTESSLLAARVDVPAADHGRGRR